MEPAGLEQTLRKEEDAANSSQEEAQSETRPGGEAKRMRACMKTFQQESEGIKAMSNMTIEVERIHEVK